MRWDGDFYTNNRKENSEHISSDRLAGLGWPPEEMKLCHGHQESSQGHQWSSSKKGSSTSSSPVGYEFTETKPNSRIALLYFLGLLTDQARVATVVASNSSSSGSKDAARKFGMWVALSPRTGYLSQPAISIAPHSSVHPRGIVRSKKGGKSKKKKIRLNPVSDSIRPGCS